MGIKIKNVKLDKDEYIYGIDKNINLSFSIESDIDENISEINILYGYNFGCTGSINQEYSEKIVKNNKRIFKGVDEKFSYVIPIIFFNFHYNNGRSHLAVDNFISIKVDRGIRDENGEEKKIDSGIEAFFPKIESFYIKIKSFFNFVKV